MRTYSEKEATDLFRRAAELQAARAHPDTPGLTLPELKRAAQAAGIEPAFLDQALTQPAATSHEPTRYLGRQTSVRRERFVPHAIDDESWGRIVRDLREQFGNVAAGRGETETLGGVHEWRRNPLNVIAEPVDGGTQLTAHASWRQEFVGATIATLVGVLFVAGLSALMVYEGKPSGAALMGVLSLFMVLPYAWAYRNYRHKAERIGAKFDVALERATARLVEAAPTDAEPPFIAEQAEQTMPPEATIAFDAHRSADADRHAPASRTRA